MIEIRDLRGVSFETLAAAFNDAFSDYLVPMSTTAAQLENMQTRRGYVAESSFGAFDGDRIVGFVLHGIDGDRAYNGGTGVSPSHRRSGIAKRLMEYSIANLSAKTYQLEVLEANERAAALYRSVGFEERRRLQCWTFDGGQAILPVPGEAGSPVLHATWFDVEPAWQNSFASIERAPEKHIVIGDDRGAAVVFPASGDLALLAVRRDSRRQGIGTKLLREAAAIAGKPIRILNIDARDEGIAAFMAASGAKPLVRQIEMIRYT